MTAAEPGRADGPAAGAPPEDAEHRPPPAGPLGNAVAAAAVAALGIAGIAGSVPLGLGSAAEPSAGTWPFLVSTAITCLGIALAVRARQTRDAEAFSSASWRVVFGLASMVGFVAVIGVVGFEIPALLLSVCWLRFLGRESWRLSLLTSAGIVVAFYLVFVGVLAVPIPHLF
ncbi:tripartite tricarboxylate transporter TctB family protein [Allonocardiopsis opalescens]|uniref:Tripartite tricarboxylate transporter TctB family protein n=1 Tax=Allonocardiopsis opalescens TaxID=1144618 RepID=A0A2T0Q1X3_9ACTN|nr:tripartite tricarboxylate transporter TctB family protein [Allonocardiopsis opalescens]PRX97710.1 tripartite tricarboxylate transporter TctB family protein [Allonocardiopsis opalescens]